MRRSTKFSFDKIQKIINSEPSKLATAQQIAVGLEADLGDVQNFLYYHAGKSNSGFYNIGNGRFGTKITLAEIKTEKSEATGMPQFKIEAFPEDPRERAVILDKLKRKWKGGRREEYLAIEWCYGEIYRLYQLGKTMQK